MQAPFSPFLQSEWVNSLLSTMSLEEKIAQVLHIAAFSNRDEEHENKIFELVEKYQIGGLIFFQGTPTKQAELTNRYQNASKIPLLISIDAEWGLGMRLQNSVSFPYGMTLGALAEDQLIYDMAVEMAHQLRRIGVHVNFAPVVDVNNNPNNPVIGFRSFGENPEKVTEKALAYVKGLQSSGILANAKHFPGHGDTAIDSHLALPLLKHSRKELEETHFYPFRQLAQKGLGSIMIAHLSVPALDSTPDLPSTLSEPIITQVLKKELGFQGLIFTDALDMKGVTTFFPSGEIEAKALQAGNDILLYSVDVPKAIAEIKKLIENGEISFERLDESVRKLLAAKQWAGLDRYVPVNLENINQEVNTEEADRINQKIADESITLLRNKKHFLGQKLAFENKKTAVVALFGGQAGQWTEQMQTYQNLQHHLQEQNQIADPKLITFLQKEMQEHNRVDIFSLTPEMSMGEYEKILDKVKNYDYVLVSLHNLSAKKLNRFGVHEKMQFFVNQIAQMDNGILLVLANAYVLGLFEKIHEAKTLILTYQESIFTQNAVLKVLQGKVIPKGKLPVTVNEHWKRAE